MTGWLVLVESNTTGTGRLFCAAARRLGLRPVLLSRDPSRYPYLATDAVPVRILSTVDIEAVLAACAALDGPVVGVTSSSEYFIGTASEAARALGLPHPDPDAVRGCRDKQTQRDRLHAAGLPGPAYAAATTPAGALAAASRIGLPVVVKPVAGSGSIGVRLCADLDSVAAAASYVLDTDPAALVLPRQRAVLVEEFLPGAEFSVETLDERVVGVTRKHLGAPPYFVETGHDFPAALDPQTRDRLAGSAVAALRALRLGWGPAHVELRLTPAGPRVVEVNPRLAGGLIPRLVQEATGVDLVHQSVARAAGRAVDLGSAHTRTAAIRFLVATAAGRLTEVAGMDAARDLPHVVEVGLTAPVPREVVPRHSFQDRLAFVIASADDGTVAARAADEGIQRLRPRIAVACPVVAVASPVPEGS